MENGKGLDRQTERKEGWGKRSAWAEAWVKNKSQGSVGNGEESISAVAEGMLRGAIREKAESTGVIRRASVSVRMI